MIKISKSNYVFLLILILGCVFRFYNINFDDLWIDELSTFWVANPDISLSDSYKHHKGLEQNTFLYNLSVRTVFKIFGYNLEIFRHLSAIFSVLSIFSVAYLSKLVSNNNAYVLSSFLISFNIFLITYAQEARVFSALLFFISLSLIFFLKINDKDNKYNLFLFIIFTIISILLHPFAIILLVSYLTFIIIFKKINFNNINISLIIISALSVTYYYFFIKNSIESPSWILPVDYKFFTNFYFSKFFGSRLIGLIYLLILIFLISKFFSKIIQFEKIAIFFILLIYSYFIPLIYSYFFSPILLARYLIFVLIPIVILIAFLIFELEKTKKIILISLLSVFTLGNLLTEQTIKQFYNKRVVYKPEFTKALSIIEASNNKNFSFIVNSTREIGTAYWIGSLRNYSEFLIKKYNQDIYYENIDSTKNKNKWVLCIHDLNRNNCSLHNSFKIHKTIKLNRIDLLLTTKN